MLSSVKSVTRWTHWIVHQPTAYKSRSLFHFLAGKDRNDILDYMEVQGFLIRPAPLKLMNAESKDMIIHVVV